MRALQFVRSHWNRILALLLLLVAAWVYYEQHRPKPNTYITVLWCQKAIAENPSVRRIGEGPLCNSGTNYFAIEDLVYRNREVRFTS
jgi:hypothetical protein